MLKRAGWILGAVLALMPMTATVAQEQSTTLYENERFDYWIQIPEEFELTDESPANGDGYVFTAVLGDAELRVWGGHTLMNSKTELEDIRNFEMSEGFLLGEATHNGMGTSIPGRQDYRRVDLRFVEMCEGTTYAQYRLEYDISEVRYYAPIIEALNRSFSSTPTQVCN